MNYDDHVEELSKFDKSVIIHFLCTDYHYLANYDEMLRKLRWARYEYESKKCLKEMEEASEMMKKYSLENPREYLKYNDKWKKAHERLQKVEMEYNRGEGDW